MIARVSERKRLPSVEAPLVRGCWKQDMPVPKPKHAPTFVPLMTPGPALDGMWPPEKHRGPYRVGRDPSINWQLLAWSWGIEDVWDLIWFHFRTDDPRETNWYMHHYLGCWRSNDGKNFSFRDADPGIVYMPPLRYRSLATVVADALSDKVAHFPYVAYKHVLHRPNVAPGRHPSYPRTSHQGQGREIARE